MLAACAALGCLAPEPSADLVAAAIRARGGPLPRWSRESAVDARALIPGRWRWSLAFRTPDRLRLDLHVDGDADQHFLFDGSAVRGFLGSAPLGADRSRAATLRTFARWMAVASLDVLTDPAQTTWIELPSDALPPGARRGLRARFRDGEASYDLGFDADLRPIAAQGPVVLPGLGEVTLTARFGDHRRIAGYRVPFAVSYRVGDELLAEEAVLSFRPDDPALDPEYFRRVLTQDPGTALSR